MWHGPPLSAVTRKHGPPLSAVTEQRLRLSALCGTAPRWRLLPKGTAPRCRLLSSSDCGSLPCVVRPPAGGCYLKGRPPAVGCYRAATAALCLVWHGSPLSVVTSRHAPPLSAVTKQRLRFYPFPAVGCNLKARLPAVGCYQAEAAALSLVWHGSPLSAVTQERLRLTFLCLLVSLFLSSPGSAPPRIRRHNGGHILALYLLVFAVLPHVVAALAGLLAAQRKWCRLGRGLPRIWWRQIRNFVEEKRFSKLSHGASSVFSAERAPHL